jgi:hypothetical protein
MLQVRMRFFAGLAASMSSSGSHSTVAGVAGGASTARWEHSKCAGVQLVPAVIHAVVSLEVSCGPLIIEGATAQK